MHRRNGMMLASSATTDLGVTVLEASCADSAPLVPRQWRAPAISDESWITIVCQSGARPATLRPAADRLRGARPVRSARSPQACPARRSGHRSDKGYLRPPARQAPGRDGAGRYRPPRRQARPPRRGGHPAFADHLDVEGLLGFADHLLTTAAQIWTAASRDQRQRLQQVVFPEGLRSDGEAFWTAVTC